MKHSPRTASQTYSGQSSEGHIVDDNHIDTLLKALEDRDCRKILEVTSEQALSTAELSETCDLPLSTTYRKVDQLEDAGLLDEQIRLSRSGKHTSEYVLGIENIQLSVDAEDGVALQVSQRTESKPAGSMLAGAD